jgi:hypothetical protein
MVAPPPCRSAFSLSLLLALAACDGCGEPVAPVASASAPPPRGSPGTVSPARPPMTSEPHVASADRRCRATCKLGGLCAYDDKSGACRARSDDDCKRSDSCVSSGLCHFEAGRCGGTSDADCRGSEQCAAAGRCSFTGKGNAPCEAREPEDCHASTACVRKGACTPVDGRCRVTGKADCERSDGCRLHGHCSPKELTGGGQKRSLCVAASNDDCAKSQVCKESGMCTAAADACR